MQISKTIPLALCAFICASCASQSPVVQNGRGGYFVSKQAGTGFSGIGDIESEIYREAQQHCEKSGKSMQVDQVEKTKPPYVLGNYPRVELNFSCR